MVKKLLYSVIIGILCIGLLAIHILHTSSTPMKTQNSENIYQKQSDKVCSMLNQAFTLYKNQQFKQAYDLAENAYWNVYDNVLEIKYRSYATPAYIFSVESDFHSSSALMTKPVSPKKIQAISKAIKSLCAEVNKEANYLNKQSQG